MIFLKKSHKNPDHRGMEELTAKDIAALLGIPLETVKSRLKRKKIEPVRYVGPTGIYDPSVVDKIRAVPGKGRPRKQAEPENQPPGKAKPAPAKSHTEKSEK
jgi:hypothetical protein